LKEKKKKDIEENIKQQENEFKKKVTKSEEALEKVKLEKANVEGEYNQKILNLERQISNIGSKSSSTSTKLQEYLDIISKLEQEKLVFESSLRESEGRYLKEIADLKK